MNLNENVTVIEKFLQPFLSRNITSLKGMNGAVAAIVFAALANRSELNVLVTVSENRARELAESVRTWLGPQQHRLYCWLPERDSVYDHTATDPEIINDRLAAMSAQMRGGGLIILPVRELLTRYYSPTKWLQKCFTVKAGDPVGREEVITKLIAGGYKRTNLVEEPGYFAVRGSLIDLFPPDFDNPVRLDFFGDELDTIKEFVVSSQRSIDKKDRVFVIPATEYIAEGNEHDRLIEKLAQLEKDLPERQAALFSRKLEHFASHADSRDYFELKPMLEPGTFSLLDYWPDARLIVEDVEASFAALVEGRAELESKFRQVIDLTPLPAPEQYYFAVEQVETALRKPETLEFSRFGQADNLLCEKVELHSPPADSSRETLIKELKSLLSSGWAVALVINDESRLNNLRGLLGERRISLYSPQRPFALKPAAATLLRGNIRKGFKDYRSRLAVFAEEDIFLGPARESSGRRHATQQNILALTQIVPGDIVVHADHGLAEFRGVHTMTAAGNTREYLLLQYAGTDKLYVPTDQVHKVSKYIGMEGFVPRIHSLNSKAWSSQKGRVSKNVEIIARELLELYAKRHGSSGFAFAEDCDLQRDMEGRFPFSETPDQLKAIEATKEDMESQVPMDRLICGDVGYGKTEVAMRAAFKAVCSGKQVAVLAPTTLLAFQHFQTFTRRFEGFPVTVDMVSRLRKASEQKETMKKLGAGTLDVLIGTHRLLSTDFAFPRLGLLIVDEEQRFGVKHKERLKQLKSQIDVLTLTATPIPRTMQMAMSGIRQISIIDTAPAERHPVQTYVAPFDPAWIKRAIIQELKRSGQIFYVFNRVEKIDQKANFLRELVPEARVAVAHGQMPEQQVEKTMLAFINQEYDILLSTTIIESGLDIANVNTLIVDEAERLGLSQMYQLRGRVGRSSRQAWAYFFYSKNKKLTKEAAERLETIEEHTALGSGFKIALRDLQIRGAGNILGESQSGHISSIGFSLYMELLEEAVVRLKSGKSYRQKVEAAIEIPVTAYFPIHYIPDEETRIELYARLSRCDDTSVLQLIKEECLDRFGQVPSEAEALFTISQLRILASEAGVKKIARIINHLRFEFAPSCLPDIGQLLIYDDPLIRSLYLNPADQNAINLNISSNDPEEIFYDAERLLRILVCVKVETETDQN
jgi:transcription-repair coupling factor (superfamily II helicase)